MARTTVRRWEYKTLRPSRNETKKEATDPQETLNDYGEEGWELAGTIEYTGGGTKFLVFKRPAEAADESVESGDSDATDGRSDGPDGGSGEQNGRGDQSDGGTDEMDTVTQEGESS